MKYIKEQISVLMCKLAEEENGLHELLKIMSKGLMSAERSGFLYEQEDRNRENGTALSMLRWRTLRAGDICSTILG